MKTATKVVRLPISRAKNAYDLLTDTKNVILEEPLRINQAFFVARTRVKLRTALNVHLSPAIPACGTIACTAGWVSTLRGAPSDAHAYDNAQLLLSGLTSQVHSKLDYRADPYYGNLPKLTPEERKAYSVYEDFDDLFTTTGFSDVNPGTKAYARKVAGKISKLQRKHETFLKAQKLRGVTLKGMSRTSIPKARPRPATRRAKKSPATA